MEHNISNKVDNLIFDLKIFFKLIINVKSPKLYSPGQGHALQGISTPIRGSP